MKKLSLKRMRLRRPSALRDPAALRRASIYASAIIVAIIALSYALHTVDALRNPGNHRVQTEAPTSTYQEARLDLTTDEVAVEPDEPDEPDGPGVPAEPDQPVSEQTQSLKASYQIKPGDTLYTIASIFSIPVQKLIDDNPNLEPTRLKPGQSVTLDLANSVDVYRVQKGDTLWSIAQKMSTTVDEIVAANNIFAPDRIEAGQLLAIPASGGGRKATVTVYFLKRHNGKTVLYPETRSVHIAGNLYRNTLTELVKGPKRFSPEQGALAAIPKATVIQGVRVEDGIAYVNLSENVLTASLDSEQIRLVLQSIANTLTEFSEIKGVVVEVNGERVAEINGQAIPKDPIKRDMSPVMNL